MKLTAAAVLSCFVFAIAFSAKPASAAEAKKITSDSGSLAGVIEFGKPPNVPPNNPPVVNPPNPPKPDRSERNPNDGKDRDPDDGDAGRGNDDREKKNDGPRRD